MRKLRAFLFVAVCCIVRTAFLEGQSYGAVNDAVSQMDSAFNNLNNDDFTPADEYYLGRTVAANILAEYKPYTLDPALTQYINRICQTLVINSSQPVIFNGYHVIILDSAEYNAFATPGGHIFVTKKLVDAAASEDMLAAVLAHEFAHITLKHSINVIKGARFTDEMTTVANRAVDRVGNSEAAKRISYFRNSVSATIDTMLKNGYSQVQEYEADKEAIAILANAGYNSQALIDMLTVLQRVQSSQAGGFNTTHPSPIARISNIRAMASNATPDTGKYREPRFNKIKS